MGRWGRLCGGEQSLHCNKSQESRTILPGFNSCHQHRLWAEDYPSFLMHSGDNTGPVNWVSRRIKCIGCLVSYKVRGDTGCLREREQCGLER